MILKLIAIFGLCCILSGVLGLCGCFAEFAMKKIKN